jgi:hypothetical protein
MVSEVSELDIKDGKLYLKDCENFISVVISITSLLLKVIFVWCLVSSKKVTVEGRTSRQKRVNVRIVVTIKIRACTNT